SSNTANGVIALGNNTTGSDNTAIGINALAFNAAGSSNIAVGFNAGSHLGTGNNNIYIGSDLGGGSEFRTIRIGDPLTQGRTFIAGINGVTVAGGCRGNNRYRRSPRHDGFFGAFQGRDQADG